MSKGNGDGKAQAEVMERLTIGEIGSNCFGPCIYLETAAELMTRCLEGEKVMADYPARDYYARIWLDTEINKWTAVIFRYGIFMDVVREDQIYKLIASFTKLHGDY